MRGVLILTIAVLGSAAFVLPAAADQSNSAYQEGSASHDYGYNGDAPRRHGGWSGYGVSSSYAYGSRDRPYSSGYRPAYGDREGYGYTADGYAYERGRWAPRRGYGGRRHCGCASRYYDDDYR